MKSDSFKRSMNRPKVRKVLECASPLVLWRFRFETPCCQSARGLAHFKTLTRQCERIKSTQTARME
jgi:hypothetical protein